MKIGFVSLPFTGHLNPIVALARKVQTRGHKVIFIGIPDIEPTIRAGNLDLIPYCDKEFPLGSLDRYPIWREAFINDADEALAKSSYDTLSPEPYQPHCDKLDLERFYATQIPKSYLNGTEDNAFPQGAEWGWHPRMSSRLGLFRLVQMPGHEVIFTNPGGLAAKLIEAGRD